ncbi:MAG: hypothetical protein U1E83_08390 [Methylotetracoccus sp.]
MKMHLMRLAALAALALAPLAANAHECRALGLAMAWGTYDATHPENSTPAPDQYWLCVGFSGENPAQGLPGAGKPNNLDFFPFWLGGKDTNHEIRPLNTDNGDKVDIKATLVYLNDFVFDINYVCVWPYDAANCPGVQPPTLFFRQLNVAYDKNGNPTSKGTTGFGYEQPIALDENGKPVYEKKITNFVNLPDPEGGNYRTYRAPKDFILPKLGTYAWIITGTLQKKGKAPVSFDTKWTCQAPRIPYGPTDLNDIDGTIVGAPEGWFDCVRYENAPTAATAATPAQGSPNWRMIMQRKGLTLAD